jgi:hypothetical protein
MKINHPTNLTTGRLGKGDVYDFMLFFNPYIEIFLQFFAFGKHA